MRRRARTAVLLLVLVAVGLLGWAGPADASARHLDPALAARVDALARAALTGGITGAVVSISDPAHGTYLRAYGSSDTAGTPMRTDARYRIASVTKTITAQAVLQLVDRHRLGLDDRLDRFVPDIPYGDRITVRDLLGMRGGVYDFVNDPRFAADYAASPRLPGWTPADALRIIRAHRSEATPPDTRTVYSNSEYVLLGLVLERVTGRPAQQVLRATARRLGLTATSYPTTDRLPAPSSRGYLDFASQFAVGTPAASVPRDVTRSNPEVPFTAGALVSTVPDMTRWARELADGAGLSPATARLRQQWTPLSGTASYGLGVIRFGGWVGHDGSILGYSDMVFHLPSRNATVVVMTNAADGDDVTASPLWIEIVQLLYPGSLPA